MRTISHWGAALFIGMSMLSAVHAQKSNLPPKPPGFNPQVIGILNNSGPVFPDPGKRSETAAGRSQFLQAQPDLAVTAVTVTALGNGQFQYQATISNLGQTNFPGNRNFFVKVFYNPPRLDARDRFAQTITILTDSGRIQPLAPGQTMTLSGSFTRADQTGSIVCGVQISQGDTNPGNDTKSGALTLGN